MNYRFYRLLLQNRKRDADSMLKAHLPLKAMTITLGEWSFGGHDPVMVFEFLTRLTEEVDLNQFSEAQALATLPRFCPASPIQDTVPQEEAPVQEAYAPGRKPCITYYERTQPP